MEFRRDVPLADNQGILTYMRAIWTGSIAFGLVNVPVKVYSATADHDIRFHQVHAKDNGRIRYKRVCEACGEVVDYRDLARAYESGDGQMVAITDDDIASLPEERSREIEVLEFVPAADVDPMMFDRSYFWSLIRSRRNRMCCWLRHSPRPTGWRSCISRCATRPGWRRCASRISASER